MMKDRKPIRSVPMFKGQSDCDICKAGEVRELEKDYKEVDEERKLFAQQYEKAISDYSDLANKYDELEKQIETMKCCGNCGNEENQESSAKCEYCIRYEGNEDEGRYYQDNWQPAPDISVDTKEDER